MIEFVKNGESLDLGDVSFPYKQQNPAFSDKAVIADFTIPVEIPSTPKNLKIFGFPNVVNNINSFTRTDPGWNLKLYGLPFKTGSVKILSASKEMIKISFMGQDFTGFGDKHMSELDWGGEIDCIDQAGLVAHAKAATLANVDVSPVAFPVGINKGMFSDRELELGGLPIRHIVFNYYDGTDYLITNPDYLNEDIEPGLIGKKFEQSMTPMPYLVYLIKQVFANKNITAYGPLLENADIRRIVTYSNNVVAVDATTQIVVDTKYDKKNHVPDMTVAEFLNSVKNAFNVSMLTDRNGNVKLVANKDILANNSYIDLTAQMIPGMDVSYNEYDGATYTIPKIDVNFEPALKRVIGTGNLSVDIKFGSPICNSDSDPLELPDSWLRVPNFTQKTNIHTDFIKENALTNWWCFYMGYYPTFNLARQMPTLSDDGEVGSQETEFALNLESPIGIYDYWWKTWAENFLLKTKLVTIAVKLTYDQILNFNFDEKVKFAESIYIVKSADHSFSRRGHGISTLELYKI